MSTIDQGTANTSRRIYFKSVGGTYSHIFMADMGDFQQTYLQNGSAYTYTPDFTQKPTHLRLTIVSSKGGIKIPDSVTYEIAGTTLAFNSSGDCTTSGYTDKFKLIKDVNGKVESLKVIGNLATIIPNGDGTFQGFTIIARAKVGVDTIVSPLSFTPRSGEEGSGVIVTIAPGDNKNFTIRDKGDSVILLAKVYINGNLMSDADVDNGSLGALVWQKLEWNNTTQEAEWVAQTPDAVGRHQLTVHDYDIDTMGTYRVCYRVGNVMPSPTGKQPGWNSMDVQDVIDASDPYDIGLVIKKNITGTGNPTLLGVEVDEGLDDSLPDAAYLQYEASLVKRDGTLPPSYVQAAWQTGKLFNPSGVNFLNIPPTGNVYKLTAGDLRAANYIGELEFRFGCTISATV